MMVGVSAVVRLARWPEDAAAIAAVDASFATEWVYRVKPGELSFQLVETRVEPPLRKVLVTLGDEIEEICRLPFAAVAEDDGRVVGLVAGRHEGWHNRVRVEHLYVAPSARSRGIGRALVEAAVGYARRVGAACLWVETQNTNYGAIRFYRRVGFRLCGLDERFYDRWGPAGGEVALFFALDLG
jgi:ribosomal protein S18 acetylase RimI-like enzyme